MVVANTTTGDVELDICHRIVALGGADWVLQGKRNLWPATEQPPDGETPDAATFVELTTIRHAIHSDGNLRDLDFQILHRFSKSPSAAGRQVARKRFFALYDVLHLSEGFTGVASGGVYTDLRAIDAPRFLEDRHYVLNITAWRVG